MVAAGTLPTSCAECVRQRTRPPRVACLRARLAHLRPGATRWRNLVILLAAGAGAVAGPAARAETPLARQIDQAVGRGTRFLLQTQNPNGSWGSATRTKDLNIYAPVPGAHHAFRSAVTALCLTALLEQMPSDNAKLAQAIDRAEAWMLRELPRLRRATPDALYNVWGHAYALTALAKLHAYRRGSPERQAALRKLMALQVQRLVTYESVDGGWGYYDFRYHTRKPSADSISFTTATVLLGMKDAQGAGVAIPKRIVARAVRSIQRQRKPDNSYLYGEYLKWEPVAGINRPGGSLGRSQVCNAALRVWGDRTITDDVLEAWLARLVARNGWLDMGRKRPVPHESHLQVAGYFYYYGHYYAGRCIELLPPEKRAGHQRRIAQLMLVRQEKDGSWWDFPFYNYHQPYGTAFAIMTLLRCRSTSDTNGS